MAACNTILYTDLQTKVDETSRYTNCYKRLTVDYASLPALYKCRAEDSLDAIKLDINVVNTTTTNKKLTVRVEPESLPTEDNYIIYCVFDPRLNNEQIIYFHTYPTAAHFIYIESIEGNTSHIVDCESYAKDYDDDDNLVLVDLMRDDKDRFFTFDYGIATTDLGDVTSLVNITSSEVRTLRFEINQFIDIGGSLSIEASMLMGLKYYMGYKRDLQKGSLLEFTDDNQFMRVVVCLDIDHASIPLKNGQCKYNDRLKPALFILNSTDSDSIYNKLIIPYPEGGFWYLTLRLFCDSVVCPCRTSENGTKYYVDTKGTDIDASSSELIREGETDCNATIVMSVTSTSCVNGRCSNHGNCGYNTFSGIVISYCSCSAGYGGKDFFKYLLFTIDL